MSIIELRKLLIEKIQLTNDDKLLEEASRLFNVDIEESNVYILNDKQMEGIEVGEDKLQMENI